MDELLKPPKVPLLRARVLAGLPGILCQQKPSESVSFSLMNADRDYAIPTQKPKEMADEFNAVLASHPQLSLENLKKIFGDSTLCNQFVAETMKPLFPLAVGKRNHCAIAYINCAMTLEYFKNIHGMTSEKPIIELRNGFPTLTLGPDLVAILRFNLNYDVNMGQIKTCLGINGKISVPSLFFETFGKGVAYEPGTTSEPILDVTLARSDQAKATLNRYLAMFLPDAQLLPEQGLDLTTEQRVKFAEKLGVSQGVINAHVARGMRGL